ncbi:MAG: ADP-ribosylglycohydrolase family protein [Spirochaetaceae bacterium]|nr:MAG: ADP-ribosylglycohydrolase family protein [Spirochaetaceae bacterium]
MGRRHDVEQLAAWARQDAELTHPHPVCLHANELFTCAIARAVRNGAGPHELYGFICARAASTPTPEPLMRTVRQAAESPVADCTAQAGWVLIALQNALWQLLHAATLEDAVIDTVMRGGDTDTNAAICGALQGAVHGLEALPQRWVDAILDCRPERGRPGVQHPRPPAYWPVEALELPRQLLG